MPFSVKDLTKEDCEAWEQNKLVNADAPKNPKTKYKVNKGSKTYNDIDKRCNNIMNSKVSTLSPAKPMPAVPQVDKYTREVCAEWEENKRKNPENPKNPLSKYTVSNKSVTYKTLNQKCAKYLPKSPKSQKDLKPQKSKNMKLTLQDCLSWVKDRTKNPLTKYTLSEKSVILKEIQRQCKPLLDDYMKQQQALPSPKKSTSPSPSPKKTSVSLSPSPPKKSSVSPSSKTKFDLHYPDLDDQHFREKLTRLAEFYIYNVPKYAQIKSKDDFEKVSNDLCGDFEKTAYQYFVSSYISNRTPYKSILLYHGVGVGKTCSAITLAEGFLTSHSMYSEPKVWVIMPLALKNSFKEQIFSLSSLEDFERLANQCTGDLYIKLGQILRESNKDKLQTKIKKLIKSRYRLFTYDAFATFIENEYINKGRVVRDKVIIVDEAHNIRSSSNSSQSSSSVDVEKRVYTSLTNVVEDGVNNRLVLLSATPMYNKPEDIFDLLYLLCLNDKRDDLRLPFPAFFNDKNVLNKQAVSIIEKLSTNYISYLKGKNPFTFAVKLSPKYIPTLTFLQQEYKKDSNNKTIPGIFDGWLSYIEDGIVTSPLGEKQLEYIGNAGGAGGADDNNVFNNLQPMNIVYDDIVGEKGFNTLFTRNENTNSLNVRYNKMYDSALYPDAEHLGKYSGKFLNICNIIKNTTGIVVIYSGYIWSGILPIAVALEHMGFNREGASNILTNPSVIPDAPLYGKKSSPKYCILSSENSEIMGNTSIDNMMKVINSPKNMDGSQIKVILITPVAGEGLSFYNVREMHLVEPWFHFNRVTQIIGRGIRNCRHQQLPLEQRNVTVFMHGSVFGGAEDRETTDIHAFRIASKKLIQSAAIENVIRDSAVDCTLMKNINYFPRSLFELGAVRVSTSQNIEIDYQYGDTLSDEPKCKAIEPLYDPLRKEAFQNIIFGMQNRLRKIVLNCIHNGITFISTDEILSRLQIHKMIMYETINASVYPNTLIDGYILVPHEDGLHIIDMSVDKYVPKKLRITYKNMPSPDTSVKLVSSANLKCNTEKLNKIVQNADMGVAHIVLSLYQYLTSDCFEELVKKFIEQPVLSEVDEKIAQILFKEGALIGRNELKSVNARTEKYIGYVNIYNNEFEPVIFVDNRYRDLTDREVDELMAKRRRVQKPANMAQEKTSWGMIVPLLNKKTGIFSNVFKVITTGSSIGVKTGMVCTSLAKSMQDKVMEELGMNNKVSTKADNCHQISIKMYELGRISINPEYKPI